MSAASLTHRLLAFARQQPLDTRPVDVNERVRSLEELIIRTIGERIVLQLALSSEADDCPGRPDPAGERSAQPGDQRP